MFEGIDATGWLVIVCALALGFGLVRFLIVSAQDRTKARPPGPDEGPPQP